MSLTVHVVTLPRELARSAAGDLGPADVARAARFRRLEDRDRALGSAWALRTLARRLDPAVDTVTRVCPSCGGRGDHGRPVAVDADGREVSGLYLTSSHAGGWIVAAAARVAVGIDVEPLANAPDAAADRVTLAAAERTLVERLPEAERSRVRLTAWLRKEALLKATGWGLAIEPRTVDVLGPEPVVPARIAAAVAAGVRFVDLAPDAAHAAVLAVLAGEPPIIADLSRQIDRILVQSPH